MTNQLQETNSSLVKIRRCGQCGEQGHYKKKCKANYSTVVKTCVKCDSTKFYTEFNKIGKFRNTECKVCSYKRYKTWLSSQHNSGVRTRSFVSPSGCRKSSVTCITLNKELKTFIKRYAKENHVFVSTLINEMILDLKQKEEMNGTRTKENS